MFHTDCEYPPGGILLSACMDVNDTVASLDSSAVVTRTETKSFNPELPMDLRNVSLHASFSQLFIPSNIAVL